MRKVVPEHKLPKNAESVLYLCKYKADGVVCPEMKFDAPCIGFCNHTQYLENAKEPKGERMFATYDGKRFFEVER